MTGNLSLYDSYLSELLETEYSVIFLCLFYIIYNKHIFKTFKKCCLSDCFYLGVEPVTANDGYCK